MENKGATLVTHIAADSLKDQIHTNIYFPCINSIMHLKQFSLLLSFSASFAWQSPELPYSLVFPPHMMTCYSWPKKICWENVQSPICYIRIQHVHSTQCPWHSWPHDCQPGITFQTHCFIFLGQTQLIRLLCVDVYYAPAHQEVMQEKRFCNFILVAEGPLIGLSNLNIGSSCWTSQWK